MPAAPFRRILRSTTARQAGTLSIGTALAQLTSVLISLLLARLYSPAEFGEMGVFSNCAAILLILSTGGYEYALVRSRTAAEARSLFCLALCTAAAFNLALTALFLAADAAGWGEKVPIPYKYMLPLYLVGAALLQALNYSSNYTEAYRRIAASSITRSLTQAAARVGLSLVPQVNGLILGSLLGNVGACLCYWRKRRAVAQALRQTTRQALRQAARRYANFPKFQLPASLLNSASTNLPVIIFAFFYPEREIGFLTMATALLYLPVTFISNSIGQVFYKKAVVQTPGQTRRLAYSILLFAGTVGGLVFFFLLIAGEERIFGLLLGSKWVNTGRYALYLCPWLLLVLCFSPISSLFDAQDRQKTEMKLNALMFATRTSVAFLGGYYLSAEHAFRLYGLLGALLWACEGGILLRMLHAGPRAYALCALCFLILLTSWGIFAW